MTESIHTRPGPNTEAHRPTTTFHNEAQAAAILGVSQRALQKWRVNGSGPRFHRLSSRCIRYAIDDLLQWTQERLCSSTSAYAAKSPNCKPVRQRSNGAGRTAGTRVQT